MTFLEQAAIAAMQGILSRPIASVHTPEEVAKMALNQAIELYKLVHAEEYALESAWRNKLGLKSD